MRSPEFRHNVLGWRGKEQQEAENVLVCVSVCKCRMPFSLVSGNECSFFSVMKNMFCFAFGFCVLFISCLSLVQVVVSFCICVPVCSGSQCM